MVQGISVYRPIKVFSQLSFFPKPVLGIKPGTSAWVESALTAMDHVAKTHPLTIVA